MTKRRILITGARAPVALHLARLLACRGIDVVLADSHRFPLSRFTRHKYKYVRLPSPSQGTAIYLDGLRTVLRREVPDLVLPTCEEIFYLAALRDIHGLDIPLLAPPFDLLRIVHNKIEFNRLVTNWGLAAPASISVRTRKEAEIAGENLGDHVLKPVWSRFGDRVIRKPSAADLETIDWERGEEWVAQAWLPGEDISAYAVALSGELKALQAYRGLFRASGGAAIAFEPVDCDEILYFVDQFVRRMQWTGQVSFDFRRDRNGSILPIECNPRTTSGLHFFSPEGMLGDLLSGRSHSPVYADISTALTMPLALWTYGLSEAMNSGRLSEWRNVRKSAVDFMRDSSDRSLFPGQLLALAEIAFIAIRARCGLKAAATADIEWNGDDI